MLLKFETRSAGPEVPSVVDATLIAVEMQAGAESPIVEKPLPDAITVAMFAARRRSMAALVELNRGLASQGEVNTSGLPRLIFTAAMLYVERSA